MALATGCRRHGPPAVTHRHQAEKQSRLTSKSQLRSVTTRSLPVRLPLRLPVPRHSVMIRSDRPDSIDVDSQRCKIPGCRATASTGTKKPLGYTRDKLIPPKQENPLIVLSPRAMTFSPQFRCWSVIGYQEVITLLTRSGSFTTVGARPSMLSHPAPEVRRVLDEGCGNFIPLPFSDGGLHVRLRALAREALRPARIRQLEPVVRDFADNLIDQLAGHEHTDIVGAYTRQLPLHTLGHCLGLASDDLSELARLRDSWLMLYRDVPLPLPDQLRSARDLVTLQRYFEERLRDRTSSRERSEDMLSALLSGQTGGRPAEIGEVVGLALDLLVAGHLTLSRALASAVALLLGRSGQDDWLPVTDEEISRVIEEVLRLESPTQIVSRVTTEAMTAGDTILPPGSRVLAHLGRANRDPRRFADPDSFDPGRQLLGSHLAFGRGPHACLGASLARLELRIGLERLYRRLPGLRLRPGADHVRDPRPETSGWDRIEVQWSLR